MTCHPPNIFFLRNRMGGCRMQYPLRSNMHVIISSSSLLGVADVPMVLSSGSGIRLGVAGLELPWYDDASSKKPGGVEGGMLNLPRETFRNKFLPDDLPETLDSGPVSGVAEEELEYADLDVRLEEREVSMVASVSFRRPGDLLLSLLANRRVVSMMR